MGRPIKEKEYIMKKCKTEGCKWKAKVKGYCTSCYAKNWRNNTEKGKKYIQHIAETRSVKYLKSKLNDPTDAIGYAEYNALLKKNKYYNDPEYRARQIAAVRSWQKENPEKVKAYTAKWKAKQERNKEESILKEMN